MKFTSEVVNAYADKLLIGLSNEETELILNEFQDIDKNIDLINEIPNLSDLSPMTHALDNFKYELREDNVEKVIPFSDVLKNCDDYEGNEIMIPKVVAKNNEE